ncbi:transcriptional regulator [Dickeya dadantii]|uniref:helix-turn-helix domain-containing protein n=1 Tax=Dickeya dadantii TaxID=204038 RepID=UPI0014960483|nr:helix-turn-helix domain-containing protein [Dickeya dadantii]NPE53788.1 transcriptional regulator [Dickeya dadantii]NPE66854.1 transcriptional regulator [Dickeya dadantii]
MRARRIDWHSADIIAALRKKGTSLSAVSREAGLSSSTLANALYRPWPKGELLIASALGVKPEEIWPSRYYDPQTHTWVDRKKLMRNTANKSQASV